MSNSNSRIFRFRTPAVLAVIFLGLMVFLTSGERISAESVVMRDGAKLVTDVYQPEGEGPWPVVLMRTPYPRGNASGAAEFNKNGFVLVVQSTRGRYGSDSTENLVFVDDGWGKNQDGYDTVQWILKQPWCSGKIGTFGGSAVGITQYLLAGSAPPGIGCQLPTVAAPNLYNSCFTQNGVLRKELVEPWLEACNFGPHSIKAIHEHPNYDDFWRGLDLTTRFDKVDWPIFHYGGWFDIFTQGTIDAFVGTQYSGGKGARGKQKVIIGPWSHGSNGKFKEIEYPVSLPPTGMSHISWFEQGLKGVDRQLDKVPAVSYFTMGAVGEPGAPGNEWRKSDVWPIPANDISVYLRKGPSIHDGVFSLEKPTEKDTFLEYTFDPANPVATLGGNNLTLESGPKDQRSIEGRDDVLVFTTIPLPNPLEVTGRIKVKLWVSSSAKDTDFTAKLTDVYPDGRSMLVCDGIMRARYRKSFEKPEWMKPGKVYPLEVDLWSTSMIFNKGHRIRLAISSSNYPRFDANPNNGESFSEYKGANPGTAPTFKTAPTKATNRIYLDSTHPSALILPVPTQPGVKY